MKIEDYFQWLNEHVDVAYKIASEARAKGFDPEMIVDIPVAKNKAERCVNLVGAEIPGIVGKGIPARIIELEEEFEAGDFRVAMFIAYEVASGKFCDFSDRVTAIEAGIRLGLAYVTLGTVSAPLEGLVECQLKQTAAGKKYLALYFAGPIRAAGGTSAAVCVLVAEYVRFKLGLAKYDIRPEEVDRYVYETGDYNSRASRLQYMPKERELRFLLEHLGVEVSGSPTTDFDVSTGKGLERVETDKVRGGMCLVLCEGVAQKAKKIYRKLKGWALDFNEWDWLKDFLKLQKELWGGEQKKGEEVKKVGPNFKFMRDAVAGRPIFSFPFKRGGFRLRYGRTRFMGHECLGFSPASMVVSNDFLALGTQLKVERPGKGCTVTSCEVIKGPVVELVNGDVLQLDSFEAADEVKSQVKRVLFLGDMLVNVGAFREHGHKLVPGAYVPERWVLELKKAVSEPSSRLNELINNPFTITPSLDEAVELSKKYSIPLHPAHLFYYDVPLSDLRSLASVLDSELSSSVKPILCDLGVPHRVKGDKLLLSAHDLACLKLVLSNLPSGELDVFDALSQSAGVVIKNIAPVFVGARMGRPEKAKLRKLKGSPHCMFPVGQEGGRLRSFNEALSVGFIDAEFQLFFCEACQQETILRRCETCGSLTKPYYSCVRCGRHTLKSSHCGSECKVFDRVKIPFRKVLASVLKNVDVQMPPLLKGVRGTMNKTHFPEPLEKGLLRAKHDLYVNKDATVRLDFTELALTHFKPCEIGTPVDKLRELGYTEDIHGAPLERSDQVLELLPQDVIIGDSHAFPGANMGDASVRITKFIDDLLERFYGLDSFYGVERKSDLIGQLIICLAPHTSAGVIGRVIGFSEIQALIAHPYMHAAVRRDCDGDEVGIMFLLDALLNFSRQYLPDRRGGRSMDAPLVLTTNVSPLEIDDEVYDFDRAWVYPLSFYEAADEFASPTSVDVSVVEDFLGKPEQYFGFGFTHPLGNINNGLLVTSYKTLETMMDKLHAQMDLAVKTKAVDESIVASLIINKHFLRDIKGNLRKFTEQSFRCVACNAKFRRLPLVGRCPKCGGKVILTVHEGTVTKYLTPSLDLAAKYGVTDYLNETLALLKLRVDGMFGWETHKQVGLTEFF